MGITSVCSAFPQSPFSPKTSSILSSSLSILKKTLYLRDSHRSRIRFQGFDPITAATHRKQFDAVAAKGCSSSSNGSGSSQEKVPNQQRPPEKKGTVFGAASLIIGTSIGSGILTLPQKTSIAGFIPSAFSIILCWMFLVIEALLLAEVNVHLRMRGKKDVNLGSDDFEVISLRTMAQETLGEWGGNLAAFTYLFLAYTSMVAYTSKSGDVLSHISELPASISGVFFTLPLALLICVGGTQITDQVNQWLTVSMIGLLLTIEVLALSFGGWPVSMTISNWEEIPHTFPVIIFSLVYHDIAPVICAYLGGDLMRIRMSILLGSLVPLLSMLIWEYIALNLPPHFDQIDSLNFLDYFLGNASVKILLCFYDDYGKGWFQIYKRDKAIKKHTPIYVLSAKTGGWSDLLPMVDIFSLLAVGTSLIGTLLGFSQFFLEQLSNLSNARPSTRVQVRQDNQRKFGEREKLTFLATLMAVFPSLLISTNVPDAFSAATDIAGDYCMTILYGVFPPAMAWAIHSRSAKDNGIYKEEKAEPNDVGVTLYKAKPLLIGVG